MISRAMLLLCAVALPAQADLVWRSVPEVIVSAPRGDGAHGEGHGNRRAGRAVFLRDSEAATAEMWTPSGDRQPLSVGDDGKAALRPSGVDNYHALVAVRRIEGAEETALRYVYMNGKPSGRSPSELLAMSKAALDIVPDPLPREHWRYLSGREAAFLLRFNGAPLADTPVRMTTSNGTLVESRSDHDGVVRVELPDDFAAVRPGRAENSAAEFIVEADHAANGTRYRTRLSAEYYVNPSRWQSGAGALLALSIGFVGGLWLVRGLPGKEEARA